MTKKQELLQGLEIIKAEHKRWVAYAEAKYNGIEIEVDLIPIKHTECECGKMIAENGQIIYHLQSSHTLAKDHEEFHKIGEQLYEFMNKKNKGNFITKEIIKKNKKKVMSSYALTLRNLSNNLLASFENLRFEIESYSDEDISKLLKM